MNGEEENASEVTESPPPRAIDELPLPLSPPSQQLLSEQPAVDQTEGREQCSAVAAAANEPEFRAEVSPDKEEKVGGGGEEDGLAVADSSSPAERSGEVLGGGESPVAKEELMAEDKSKIDEETSETDGVEKELIEAVDSLAAKEKGDGETVAEEEVQAGEEKGGGEEAKKEQAAHDDERKGGIVGERESRLRSK